MLPMTAVPSGNRSINHAFPAADESHADLSFRQLRPPCATTPPRCGNADPARLAAFAFRSRPARLVRAASQRASRVRTWVSTVAAVTRSGRSFARTSVARGTPTPPGPTHGGPTAAGWCASARRFPTAWLPLPCSRRPPGHFRAKRAGKSWPRFNGRLRSWRRSTRINNGGVFQEAPLSPTATLRALQAIDTPHSLAPHHSGARRRCRFIGSAR